MQDVRQPFLHELVACVRAPSSVLSGADGQIRHDGPQGLFHADVRHLAELVVIVDGEEPDAAGYRLGDDGEAVFVGVVRTAGDPHPDPTVRIERTRRALAAGFVEEIAIVNDSRGDVTVTVTVTMASDMASVALVKMGVAPPLVAPAPAFAMDDRSTVVTATGDGAATSVDGDRLVVRWHPTVGTRARATLVVGVEATGARVEFTAASRRPDWSLAVRSAHSGLGPLVHRSLDDLRALLLDDGTDAGDVFAAAGMPWYLTLFGRDSLWAARFALPVGVDVAAGTLRVLARRQAGAVDIATAAEPGKILHEVRNELAGLGLPPLYYGTVDATPLWISLLHDAWCWGLDEDDARALLGPLEAALAWVIGHDPFLAYRDESGHGLSNQGWKDSGDAIQDAGGHIAPPPITLCEVQGYAYRAALDGARLLDAFDRPGGDAARAYAAELATAFRERFWVDGPNGRFPVVALDGEGRAVDSLTSNIGHLPATGMLDGDEIAAIAAQVRSPRLDSGHGLRTMADDHPQYNPLGYHTGSVWPHDTAITIDGLARTGHGGVAGRLAAGLLDASMSFDWRLPELFGGWPSSAGRTVPYPASCRPQAWAAAAAFVIVRAALGLHADVPAGTLAVRPDPGFAALFPLSVTGLRVGRHRLDVHVDASGQATVDTDARLTVITS
jgi:glycogen debranching enzyme